MKKNYFLSITLILIVGLTSFSQTTTYDFNGSNSGWEGKFYAMFTNTGVGSTSSLMHLENDPGAIAINLTGGYERCNNAARIQNKSAGMDTSKGNFLNITISNTSLNKRMKFVNHTADPTKHHEMEILPSTAAFTTYTFDMTGKADWTGILDDLSIRFNHNVVSSDSESNSEVASGDILFDEISITATKPLSVNYVNFKDDTSISVYPNPANDVISIKSGRNIKKITAYNILGQLQKLATKNLNSIDVSSLNKGVYILKFYQNNGVVSTKRFVKN